MSIRRELRCFPWKHGVCTYAPVARSRAGSTDLSSQHWGDRDRGSLVLEGQPSSLAGEVPGQVRDSVSKETVEGEQRKHRV